MKFPRAEVAVHLKWSASTRPGLGEKRERDVGVGFRRFSAAIMAYFCVGIVAKLWVRNGMSYNVAGCGEKATIRRTRIEGYQCVAAI